MFNNTEEYVSDTNIFETRKWAKDLKDSVNKIVEEKVSNWCQVVVELGEDDVELDEWIDIFKSQVEEKCKELVTDVIGMKEQIVHNFVKLLDKVSKFSRQLGLDHENLRTIDPNKTYYKLQKELQKKVEELEKTLNEKTREVENLLSKQQELCDMLKKLPMSVTKSPLPSPSDIEKLQQYIEALEQEKFNREEEYIFLKSGIVEMSKNLELTTPKSDFERDILSTTKCDYDLSLENLRSMREYHNDLKVQLENRKQEIDSLKENLEDLWIKLELSRSQLMKFKEDNEDYSLSTLKALKVEMRRLEILKKENLKVFVEKLRAELNELWKNCYHNYTIDDELYECFVCDSYSEDMLTIHEMEVEKWRRYYEKNEELLKLFTEHQKLWKTMLEMENKNSDDVNRYKNRGGQLLREEKERNKLSKKIPLMEEKIKSLAKDYEELHGVPFSVFKIPIVEFIDNLYSQREQDRKIKLSARKTKLQETLTPAKSSLNLFPSSRILPTPTSASTLKRKLEKPATTGKKLKVYQTPTSGATSSVDLKSVQTANLNRTRRLSREKKKRVAKCLKYLNMNNNKNNKMMTTNKENNINETNITDYDAFERDLTSKEDGLSTLKGTDLYVIPTLKVIPPTPVSSRQTEKTPKSGDGKTTKKLTTTPGKLKLFF